MKPHDPASNTHIELDDPPSVDFFTDEEALDASRQNGGFILKELRPGSATYFIRLWIMQTILRG